MFVPSAMSPNCNQREFWFCLQAKQRIVLGRMGKPEGKWPLQGELGYCAPYILTLVCSEIPHCHSLKEGMPFLSVKFSCTPT